MASEEKKFENVDRRTTYDRRRTTDAYLYYKFTNEPSAQVSQKSDQWSRQRICDNEIVTVLSNGQLEILKMAAVRPYLLTDQNRFRADTSRR